MRRHILGVVAATVAAPYLIVIVAELPFDKTDGPGLLFGMQVATGALMFFGIPTLIVAGICAAILYRLKLQTRGWCMLGGAGVGLSLLGLILLLFGATMNFSFWPLLFGVLAHLLSGALCGWIYWRIALGPRAPETAGAR